LFIFVDFLKVNVIHLKKKNKLIINLAQIQQLFSNFNERGNN
jgi:hypothetical protein